MKNLQAKKFPLPSTALGVIVGNIITPSGTAAPFIWDGNGLVQNLNDLIPADSGWNLQWVGGIDDSGDIAGNGLLNGIPTGFLLTPTTSSSSSLPTPEPTTLPLLLSPALPLLRRHPRKSP